MSAEWVTPKQYVNLARKVMGEIDLDPASSEFSQRNVQAANYFTPQQDGLSRPWFGRVWLCPPNGRNTMRDFTAKLIEDFAACRVTEAIVLVPNAGDTRWYHRLAGLRLPVCLVSGRIRFESPTGKSSIAPNGQTFFYLGDNPERFKEVFSTVGRVWKTEVDSKEMAAICIADRAAISARALAA